MSEVTVILSTIAFIACFAAPIAAFLVYRRIKRTQLKTALMTFLTGLILVCIAQVIRLLLPLFSEELINTLRIYHNLIHLIGNVFFIRAVFEFRDYSKVFGFKK